MMIEKMVSLLSGVPAGAIPASIRDALFNLVEASWHEFAGSGETSMEARKILRDRGPEDVSWSPPCLSFTIDRHGGTVQGSKRAEKQRWILDLETRTADHLPIGFRQLRPNAPKLDVKLLADDVCKAVQEGQSSASSLVSAGVVVWKSDDELTVYHGKIVGGAYQRTVSGRRMRFIADLETKMQVIGWDLVSRGRGLTFKKTK